MKPIGGMLVGYYLICPRKAWLSAHGLWMEQESEAVALGKLLDESSYGRDKKQIMVEAETPQGVPLVGMIDRANLREGVLHETKKGRACEEAHVWQVRFYLWLLRLNGVRRADGNRNTDRPFTGQIDYPALRRTEPVTLTNEHEQQLAQWTTELQQVLRQPTPPPRISQRKFCRKCAFEELCYG